MRHALCAVRYAPCVLLKRTTQYARRSTHGAFTFIELFFVIIIIGILIGASIPAFRNTFSQLQLNSFSRELQSFMNYLHERSIIERKIIYLAVDNENKQYWAGVTNSETRLKTASFPKDIDIEVIKKGDDASASVFFYPDGSIEKATLEIKLISDNSQKVTLTTQKVFGRIKMQIYNES